MFGEDFSLIVLEALLIAILLILLLIIIDGLNTKKLNKKYIENFRMFYDENKNVKATLESLKTLYKPKSDEIKLINKALFYLNHSILMDYKTALSYIEKKYDSKEVKEFHKSILSEQKEATILRIEQKENTQ